MREFNWLGECTSCNIDCCHNTDKFIHEYACSKPKIRELEMDYEGKDNYDRQANTDERPLECRLFPFDIKEIDDKLVWVKWDNCHAGLKLNYEKFMDFFERKFAREMSLEQIKRYATYHRLNSSNEPHKDGREYVLIREVNWPHQY